MEDVVQFALDYTFWLNLLMVFVTAGMVALHLGYVRGRSGGGSMDMGSDTWSRVKRRLAYLSVVVLLGGVVSYFLTG